MYSDVIRLSPIDRQLLTWTLSDNRRGKLYSTVSGRSHMKMSCWIIRSKALVFSLVLLLGVAGFLHNNNVFIHHHHHFSNRIDNQQLPVIYVITPTYRRLVQIAELTQLAQTLSLVPSVHWIVVEDSQELSPDVIRLLQRFTGLSIGHITHLHGRMPEQFRANDSTTPYTSRPRGASNRNRALHWIRENVETGVVYFADDDNTYDVRIFQEMRDTKTISMWPVGLIGIHGVSSPVVDPSTGYVKAFFDGWIGDRTYPVDMASFAINVQLLHQNPDAVMSYRAGYQEDSFLKSLNFTLKDIEPKANNCTEILVWHTQNGNYKSVPSFALKSRFENTNVETLRSQTLNLSLPVV